MKLRLLGAVCACLANVAQATSTSSAAYDWSTFAVTANGTNITNSISWNYQGDFIDTRYIEGATEPTQGNQIETFHDIDPNNGWGTSQTTNDGGVNTNAIASVMPNLVSAATEVNHTGQADVFMTRIGEFTVTADARFSFSVDYSLSAEITMTNSETGGGQNSLLAAPFVDFQANNLSTGQFGFVFDGSVDLDDTFGMGANSGTLTVNSTNNDANNNPGALFDFKAGEVIEIMATARTESRSYSSPSAVPVPPALALFMSGLGALAAFGRKRKSAMVNRAS